MLTPSGRWRRLQHLMQNSCQPSQTSLREISPERLILSKRLRQNEGRIVRGRQVLFMLHDRFSTNMKHGSTYALQDLFGVHLKGENLKTFISNWGQVLAGIQKVPEESVLQSG